MTYQWKPLSVLTEVERAMGTAVNGRRGVRCLAV